MPGTLATLTPYPEVNQVLNELLSGAQTALRDRFVGLYLYGSLALGDFNPDSSDIDFVVVTDGELSRENVSALQALHERIALAHPRWATEIEGSYIPRSAMRRYDPAHANHLHVFEGRVWFEEHGVHWVIERHVLREYGVTLAGPAPHTLIDPVQPDELRRAVTELIDSWWAAKVEDPSDLSAPKYQAYAVVTMCRALYTLAHGTVTSKPAAARWACATLDERWQTLIDRSGGNELVVAETCAIIRYTMAQCAPYR